MSMWQLAFRNLIRRPLRSGLTLWGLATAVAVLTCLGAFARGYERSLNTEMNGMGMQMMLVPLGCPYDAAARVLKGKTLETSLPESVLAAARRDPAVAVAAPLLLAAIPSAEQGHTDLWAGIDRSVLQLKPWWKAGAGKDWFRDKNSVILGAEAAAIELRAPGDRFYSPDTRRTFRVAGTLAHSGTSDDSLFFVPLATAQAMFKSSGRLTAVAIRLRDPSLVGEAARRLQQIPGAQVVTLSEMMGTFLNLLASVRTLLWTIGIVALAVSVLGVFNTMLSSVIERTGELALLRAIGASRLHLFGMVTLEALCLATLGSMGGLLLEQIFGKALEHLAKGFVPLATQGSLLWLSPDVVLYALLTGIGAGLLASLYPAWRACCLPPARALAVE